MGVPAAQVDLVWPHVLPLIERVLAQADGDWSAADIRAALAARDMQLWLVLTGHDLSGCFVTELVRYPQQTAARCILLAGTALRDWLHLEATVADWARAHGAGRLEAWCRPGIRRLFAAAGYAHLYEVIAKEL